MKNTENSPQIKGILFDFNGTLFFDSCFHIDAFKKYFTAHGKDEPSSQFIVKNIFGRSNRRIFSDFFDHDPSDEDWMRFADEKEGLYRRSCLENPHLMKYVDGVPEMLDYLKANSIPYCLATGSGMDNIEFYMEHMDLCRWFSLGDDQNAGNIVYFDNSFNGKPAPDTYILAAKKLGLDPSQCVVFEDATSGILSANSAGAAAVVCVHEDSIPSPVSTEIKYTTIIKDFTHWRELLSSLGVLR